MALTSLKWGTQTLRSATSMRRNKQFFGATNRVMSGDLRVQEHATKYQIEITWDRLTEAQRQTLENAWNLYNDTVAALEVEDSNKAYMDVIYVLAVHNGWTETVRYNKLLDQFRYDITLRFDQVPAP